MKQAWKSDDGKYYDSEMEAAKADAEYWKQKAMTTHADRDRDYHPLDRGDAAG